MKLSKIDTLGISHATKENLEIDATLAIIDDEFNKRDVPAKDKKNYRERAIDRMIDLRIPFHSEQNIVNDLIKKSIIMVCPYCSAHMEQCNSSGAAIYSTVYFNCPSCRSIGTLTVQNDGITFAPSK